MTTTITIEIPAELEGVLAQMRSSLKATDGRLASDALVFALRRGIDGMPLEPTLLASLETHNAVRAAVRERVSRLILTGEKAVADAAALQQSLAAITAELAQRPR
jgi:hypothetical protein